VSPARYITLTRIALWSLTIIVVSGGSVRLTGSGLGCSDWPNCEQNQFVASLEYHALIEFVNRMFTGVVAIAVIAAVLGSLRRSPRRPDLVWWSWGLVAGVIAQIILGGLLVKTDLDPRFTMGHFLLSMVLLWNATVLVHRASLDEAGPAQDTVMSRESFDTRRRLRQSTTGVALLSSVLLVSGTIVTGTGPHSGSDNAEVADRLPFLVRDVVRIHALIAIATLGLVFWVGRQANRLHDTHTSRQVGIVAALLVAQGSLGYLQYFTGVPVLLVAIHITLASLTWIAIVRLSLHHDRVGTVRREPEPVS
jgi:heme a synthase